MLLSLQGSKFPPAILALADGTVFIGSSIGSAGSTTGEAVFSTALCGYQEALTDPSYRQHLLCFSYPHIGNYGINAEDMESAQIQAAGLVIKDLPLLASNFRSEQNLQQFLQAQGTVAIADIDTRKLTRLLREKGAQMGAILALQAGEEATPERIAQAVQLASQAPAIAGRDLVAEVSTDKSYGWTQTPWVLGQGFGEQTAPTYHVAVLDLGVKRSSLRALAGLGCRVTVLPASTPAQEILALAPNGVYLSSGPGDAGACGYAIATTKALLEANMPLFGQGLGMQVLALAAGGQLKKLHQGHYGVNHPVKSLRTGRTAITAQNHGFAVDEGSLPANLQVSHISLFDGSVQGVQVLERPAFGHQGFPENNYTAKVLERFVAAMSAAQSAQEKK